MTAAACAHEAWPTCSCAGEQPAVPVLHADHMKDTEIQLPDWLFQQTAVIDLAASPWAACTAELQRWDCQLEMCPATRDCQALACQCPRQPHLCGWWALQLPCRSRLGAKAFCRRGESTPAQTCGGVLCATRIVSWQCAGVRQKAKLGTANLKWWLANVHDIPSHGPEP